MNYLIEILGNIIYIIVVKSNLFKYSLNIVKILKKLYS